MVINIDIETFSSVNLLKSGLYKYAQSPDFQVLLFAYAIGGGETQVVDLIQGESIPDDVISMLFDPRCVKRAFNAAFEWYCLSQHFKLNNSQTLDWLAQWNCTMLHGLYCGYPGSLAGLGKALGLSEDKQKMTAGKALIKVFCVPCKPTNKNGGRTRNLPHHEPEKWELFKAYNKRDVETELEISNMLSSFPVPEGIQQEWITNEIISLRGVKVDIDLIDGALYCSKQSGAALTEEAKSLTNLENPNSVSQLTDWLRKNEVSINDLRKETVQNLVNSDDLMPEVKRVLELRKGMGKTSVKKYTAMVDAVCADGRVRGLLQFYGGNRTGRWAGRLVQVQNLPRTYGHQVLFAIGGARLFCWRVCQYKLVYQLFKSEHLALKIHAMVRTVRKFLQAPCIT